MSQQSEQINEIVAALSKAQGELKDATKDSKNDHFKSKYADLASVLEACRAPLSKHGLAVIQTTEMSAEGHVSIRTTLAHASGQYFASMYPVIPVKNDPQGYGSAITYARRYCLMAIVGIAPAEDDGEAASGRGDTAQQSRSVQTAQRQPARGPANASAPVDPAEREECTKLLKMINGEIKRCEIEDEVDRIISDNAADIERIGKCSIAGKDQILNNAAEMKTFLRQQKKEAA